MDVELLPILQAGEPVLRQPAEPLDPAALGTPEVARLVEAMVATMRAAPGVGLAAPQVGEPVALAVLEDDAARWVDLSEPTQVERGRRPLPLTVLANPVVTPVPGGGTASFFEGCLSVDGWQAVVPRAGRVLVDALDEHGEPVHLELEGWPARIAQHEVDHLGGVLYVDRMVPRSLVANHHYRERWHHEGVAAAAQALGFEVPPSR